MPQVPVYHRQVEEVGIPNVNIPQSAPLEAFGGGQGLENTVHAARSLSNTVADIALKQKLNADELAVQDADLKLSQQQAVRETETASYRGKDAAAAPDTIKTNWHSDASDIRETLTNDNQKAAFDRKTLARTLQLNDYVQKHVSTELTKYDKAETDSYLDNAQREAARHPEDPSRIQTSILQQAQAIKNRGLRIGQPPEETEKQINEAINSTHLGVVDRLISDENFDFAQAYLDETKSFLTGDQVRQSQSLIESGREKAKQNKKINDDAIDKALFLRTLPDAKDPLSISELNNMGRNGVIDRTMYDTYINRVGKVNDDIRIPTEDKGKKLYEIAQAYTKLNAAGWGGAQVDAESLLPAKPTKGNRLDALKEFRKTVSDNAQYLTKEQERAFYLYTQTDLNDAMTAKAGIFDGLMKHLKNIGTPNPSAYVNSFLSKFDDKIPVAEALQTAEDIKQKALVAGNPNRTKYVVGQIITNPNGLKGEVKGFDAKGNPIIEAIK